MGYLKIKRGEFIVEADFDDCWILLGGNQHDKDQLILTIKRLLSSSLSELEEEIFGESGMQMLYNDKILNKQHNRFIYLGTKEDLFSELTLDKKSIFFELFNSLQHHHSYQKIEEKINEQILALEVFFSAEIRNFQQMLDVHIKDFSFIDLVKHHVSIGYLNNEREVPNYMVSDQELVDTFVNVIRYYIEHTGKTVWLVVDKPETFLYNNYVDLYRRLRQLASETQLLKLIINHHFKSDYYTAMELSDSLIFYQGYQKLPDYEKVFASIERHYPGMFEIEIDDLSRRIYTVSGFLGKNIKSNETFLQPKSMVILSILKELLEDTSLFETSNEDLSNSEKLFLLEH